MMRIFLATILFLSMTLLSGCSIIDSLFGPPQNGESPAAFNIDLQDIVRTLGDVEIPDLSGLQDVPGFDSLPLGDGLPGGIIYRGPVQRRISAGEQVPGTDIQLVRTSDEGAEFQIAGMRSVRVVGDSLDFDGEWPELPGVTYSARLRIYQVGDGKVRYAGVHQLGIPNIAPSESGSGISAGGMKFPFLTNVARGELISGTTFGYDGVHDRGAILSGQPANDYPYRKAGDSIRWRGNLRPEIPVEYNVRVIHFDDSAMQVGGVVTVRLPSSAEE